MDEFGHGEFLGLSGLLERHSEICNGENIAYSDAGFWGQSSGKDDYAGSWVNHHQ